MKKIRVIEVYGIYLSFEDEYILFMEAMCDFMTLIINNLSDFLFQFREWYENRNMRQIDVAEKLEITRSHLNKVLNEKTQPSIKLLNRMILHKLRLL